MKIDAKKEKQSCSNQRKPQKIFRQLGGTSTTWYSHLWTTIGNPKLTWQIHAAFLESRLWRKPDHAQTCHLSNRPVIRALWLCRMDLDGFGWLWVALVRISKVCLNGTGTRSCCKMQWNSFQCDTCPCYVWLMPVFPSA